MKWKGFIIQQGTLPEDVAKRAFYLAWQASGPPLNMGIFQDRPGATEEEVWQNILTRGDYSGEPTNTPGEAYADYVFGRMMKLRLSWQNNELRFPDNEPDPSYSAWAIKYPTYESLVHEAAAQCGCEVLYRLK